ncbi:MAG: peptidylprolyl isomerase [Methanophagales archaeon ANME-1-THS]|nr:MAG: peptidylprolyl isomerase [Methanophagales archaeon ANME-1-THS]
MRLARHGDTVKVHYTGKLEDGTVFDSSRDRDPLQFTLGEGQVIPGFEQAVVGMNVDESKTVTIPMEKAYGAHREEMVLVVGRNKFPEHLLLEVGQQLQIRLEDGQLIFVTVTEVTESSVTLDANHPLAGKDLTFDIHLVAIG